MATVSATSLPFEEAIDYFRQKVNLPTASWTDFREGMHARAFVIAGAMKEDLLKDFRGALQKALDEGTTLADFRRDFDSIVARHGWDYNGGRNWRSRVIYDANMRTARAAGKWQQINRAAARERKRGRVLYLRYVAVRDEKTRPDHRDWHGLILPVDHPFWATHTPPNGWFCRCDTMVLTERDLRRYGYAPTPENEIPDIKMEDRRVNLSNGSTANWPTPEGIDTGWGHNPGQSAWGTNLDERVMTDFRASGARQWEPLGGETWETLGLPADLPADPPRASLTGPASDRAALARLVERTLGAAERTLFTPDGMAVHVTAQTLADHLDIGRAPFVPFIPEVLEDPAEIWLAWERHALTGKVELRKRFVKVLDLGKDRRFLAVVNAVGGRFEAWTFLPVSSAGYANRSRRGQVLYAR